MPVKRRQGKSVTRTLRKTRVTWSRLYYLKSNPDRGIIDPAANKLTDEKRRHLVP